MLSILISLYNIKKSNISTNSIKLIIIVGTSDYKVSYILFKTKEINN